MNNQTKIAVGGVVASVIAGVGILGMEIELGSPPSDSNAKNAVDKILATKVVRGHELKGLLDIVKDEKGSELRRLKQGLLPLANKARNNEKIDVLPLDKYFALISFGANITVKMENEEDFHQAVYRYINDELDK